MPYSIDPLTFVPVGYLMNGLNISLSLYFALKTSLVLHRRRTPIWYILLALQIALFLSTVETVSDILIWGDCRGGRFSCFMYGFFYLGVTSVGFFRLYAVSGKNRVYVYGRKMDPHPGVMTCIPDVPKAGNQAVTIVQILCSAIIVSAHLAEIGMYVKKTNDVSMSGLVHYFQDYHPRGGRDVFV
ncbi:hypothetical protein HK097_000541 [Rhizophlyctis rosea]|uniref:Uncharacterized protein n=1 Tax=Rhizophlyctis rosea TaxID=64517 RepID=A0AAD5X2H7_9FUNG|nr:hypothetical protein HK097_000541 [Rhizophlyctis rosea]